MAVVESKYTRSRTARILLTAIRKAIKVDSACFMAFLDVLDEPPEFATLPEVTRKTIVDGLWNEYLASARRSGPVQSPVRLRFTGPLKTKWFRKIDRAYSAAIHAGQAKLVNVATKKILSTEKSLDIKIMCILFRASSKAVIRGQLDKALLDCDTAIKAAKRPECENGSLIIGFALRMKTAILRTEGRFDEALECVCEAKAEFHLAAPSSDTAALLYEYIRLKTAIAESKKTNPSVCISDVESDFERLFRHSHYLDECNRPKLCIFLNYKAELMLRTAYAVETLPPSWTAPTDEDVRKAEAIFDSIPLNVLSEEAYVYRGWHYLAKADLYMVKKQYYKAIEWAKKSHEQFAKGGITYVTKPTERIMLYTTLQSQELLAKKMQRRLKVRDSVLLFRQTLRQHSCRYIYQCCHKRKHDKHTDIRSASVIGLATCKCPI